MKYNKVITFLIIILVISCCLIELNFRNVSFTKIKQELFSNTRELTVYKPNEFTSDDLFKGLVYISDLFKKYKIKHWLMYGTLLGAVRNKNIIPYDYDIDIGADIKDKNKILNMLHTSPYFDIVSSKNKWPALDLDRKWYITPKWRVSLKVMYKKSALANKRVLGHIYLYLSFNDGITRRFSIKYNLFLNDELIGYHTFHFKSKNELL